MMGFGLIGLAGLSLTTIGTAGAAAVHFAGQPQAKKSNVKPDLGYFAGKTITFIVGSAAGSGGDGYARPLAPYIDSYLHATVNIEDISTASGIPAENQVGSSAPNGLVIGELAVTAALDGDVYNTAVPSFSLQRVALIAGIYPFSSKAIFAKPTDAIKNVTEFIKSKSASPILDVNPGSTDLETRVFAEAYKANVRFVTGYTGDAALEGGFIRGDGPFVDSGIQVFLPLVEAGQANALVLLNNKHWPSYLPGYSELKSVPDVAQYAVAHPPKTRAGKKAIKALDSLFATPTYAFFAPEGTPANIVLALTDAFHYALTQTALKGEYVTVGNVPGYTAPTILSKDIHNAVASLPILRQLAAGS